MKKIGFIDYYLYEWHANNYPEMIERVTGGDFKVCYAYGEIDSPKEDAQTNAEWAKNNGIELLSSIEEVVEKSDYIVVLSPDHPEHHEKLSALPLASGKRVYIDKTFAPDKASAQRIFDMAEKHNTPCFSSSALRFASEYQNIDRSRIETIGAWGDGTFSEYAIHQIEPIVSLMGVGAKRIMFMGSENFPSLYIEFKDGRHAQVACYPNEMPFLTNIGYNDASSQHIEIKSEFFDNFIKEMIKFFETGVAPVPHEQTIEVIAIREAGIKAMATPNQWVEIN